MDHTKIMRMITSPSSWEQVIYEVIAFEGLDPWDLDLTKLVEGFLEYMKGLEQMDFKIPAKYVMVASTLLRMKSDHLPLLNYFQEQENGDVVEEGSEIIAGTEEPALNPLTIPPRRLPQRRVVISELVQALRKVLGTQKRRELRNERAGRWIYIYGDDLGKRISSLYDRINAILSRVRKKEVGFSKLVTEWNKPGVANTFLPLIYLDNQKKVECRQEEIFDEIYVKRGKFQKETKRVEKQLKQGKKRA